MAKHLLLLILPLLSFTAIATDSDPEGAKSSVSIAINGVKFFQAREVTVEKFTFGEDVEFDIKGKIGSQRRGTAFMITIPSLEEGVYTKANSGSVASVSLDYTNMYLSSSGPFIPNVDDLADYVIEITHVSEELIEGNFVATLQDGMTTETLQISGDFVLSNKMASNLEASASTN